jgi:lysophospholipid acyltransferase (LPLAT)-like uncharacterized protein
MTVLRSVKWALIGFLGRCYFWFLAKTSRMKVIGGDKFRELRQAKRPAIILAWHGRIFIVPYFFRKQGMVAMVSPSEDGEIVVRIASTWGYTFVRGSGSHSIVKAWVEMKTELERGGAVIHVPDGPKGPDREMKMGAIKLAQQTGASLVPFTFSATKKKLLSSWDKFMIFYPFGKVVVMLGAPMTVPADAIDDELEDERRKVEEAMNRLEEEADRYFQPE